LLQGLIFVGLFVLVVGPIHWYLWRRLVKDTTRPGRWRKIGTAAIVALVATLLIAFVGSRLVGIAATFAFELVGYVWLALLFYLLIILLVLEIPRLVLLRKRPSQGEVFQSAGAVAPAVPDTTQDGLSRRLVISRSAAIFAGLTATGLVGSGVRTALGPPVLKRIQIPLSKLPRGLDGYRIALVADIHLGPLTGVEHARRIVEAINGMDADLVAVVGDLVDGGVAELSEQAAPLRRLRSRDGAFFVTGNHEYYSGVEEWMPEVGRLGMRVLRNERVEIRGLDLAGVDDVTGAQYGAGGPDFAKALGDRDPAKPVVLLAHQPVMVRDAAKYKVDLQLSGHTHGGQMVPFNYIVKLQQPVVTGYAEVDGTKVYVTNGAGFWGPPVRVGAPPDITLVELRSA
jgi:predicted MPP superfamily phosphohydrolase